LSWNLHKADLGDATRGKFAPDPKLPNEFNKVATKMYSGGGIDRGHMCNSADRTNSELDNDATFFMTNVIPQSANNNQKAWERLETYCRVLAREGKDLHIVCGPFGVGGTGLNGQKTTIGPANCKITVPSLTWKVILVLPKDGAEPTKRTRTIAVRMPNDMSVTADWTKYRVSIAEIEEMTGYKFFSKLAPDLATALKEDVDDVVVTVKPVGPPKKKKKKTPAPKEE
jgi:endonuclease G, mitochondrial